MVLNNLIIRVEPVAAVVVKARLEAMGRVILPVQVALVWRGQTA